MLSNVTLLYFLLLFPLAGFIAWAGDYIGHRTGKRRHSFCGLRPRHTARLFTIASGIAIVCVSFGLFWLCSESFRVIVREGQALFLTNQQLKKDNRKQAQALHEATQHLESLRGEVERLARQREQAELARNKALVQFEVAEKRRKQAEQSRSEAEKRYELAQSDLENARTELTQARESVQSAQNRLGFTRTRLKQEAARLNAAEQRLTVAEQQVAQAEHLAEEARSEQRKAEKNTSEAREQIASLARDAQEAINLQKKKQEELRIALEEQNEQYAALAAETEKQRLELARVNRELAVKRREYDTLVTNTAALRGKQITYQVGEEVDRIAINPGQSVWRIQYLLDTFMATAAKKAEKRGAARDRAKKAVMLFSPTVTENEKPALAVNREEEEKVLYSLANKIRSRNTNMLVVACAAANAVAGEPVAINLNIYDNPVVLKKDARLGDMTLHGDWTRQEMADALYTFLTREIHQELIKAGMIPPARGGEESGEEFSLSGEEWFRVMDEVRKAGTRPQVIVYAAKDLRAGDPVSLRFSVRAGTPFGVPPGFVTAEAAERGGR
ncbi:MAG: hypothetical protein OHK0029_40910 [Armatimonadaceae bacterium]